ncbi:hypothetical protein Poli38472_008390 [Pythium oligandrum]|uniref:Nuclear control of ATPase protein 2 n=1 Tax=Pythium oligandrum TaxID=41045 RepID=A0A8K1CMR2_PYTOL|nr:hypothetical protein Poli38472_008390 [Pythium oligandrum]|eukprot:TMW65748.1 hypothetical protein Poli38472_008390 [Pythium oligandrum]
MRGTSSLSVSTQVTASMDALMLLSRDQSSPLSCAQHAELLARALALVKRRHSIAAPTRARDTILGELDEVKAMLRDHPLATVGSQQEDAYTLTQQQLLDAGVRGLWTNVVTYELFVALADLIAAVDFIPHALRFWKLQRRRPVRAMLRRGPEEWLLPDSELITLDERIYSLETTFNAILEKLGQLKHLTTRLMNGSANADDQLDLLNDGLQLLVLAYNSRGIVPPRKGKGAFKTLQALNFTPIRFESYASPDTTTRETLVQSLEALYKNLLRMEQSRAQFTACFKAAMAPCHVPSKIRQRWLQLSLAGVCAVAGGVWIVKNQRDAREGLGKARLAMREFLNEHMIEPLQAIVGEVILNQKPEIQDAAALLDTRESLQRMLSDFARDTNPNITSSELQRIVKDMDMSVVSLQYEKQLGSAVRNLMSGDIVRMLLIQVQFIKKELMVAMGAIDELMHANQLNLQVMATIPTFLVFGGVYTLAKALFAEIYKRTSERLYYDMADIAGFLRNILRDIERLLNKQNRVSWPDGTGEDDAMRLGTRDLGLLLLLLHQLHDVYESNREFFEEEEQQRFDEDLNDLVEEGLLVSQQLAVIQRMYHSYPFLQRTKLSSKWIH